MEPITDITEAQRILATFEGPPETLALPISDTLQDTFGMNMAIITDAVLDRGWEPDGYEQCKGFRIYRYKAVA